MADGRNILVIKLGALGDFVLAMGPFAAIRRHHPDARITLLTSPAYATLAKASPYFDAVWTDGRPTGAVGLWRLLRKLRRARFDRVYDLQRSDRTALYFRLLAGRRPEWNGVAPGCSHPHRDPRQHDIHTVERQKGQLAEIGIDDVPDTDLAWVGADVGRFDLPARYALLVPGGSAHRPEKRWPDTCFAEIAHWLVEQGFTPLLLGAAAEAPVLQAIAAACPQARDLGGRTDFNDIVALARGAVLALGNDTGPMHLVAAAGCPALVLFGAASDPSLTAPRGPAVALLQTGTLDALSVRDVIAALKALRGSRLPSTAAIAT